MRLIFLLLALGVIHTSSQAYDPVMRRDSLEYARYLFHSGHVPQYITTHRTNVLPVPVEIEKQLIYDKYTLDDTYPYGSGTRSFQWDKIAWRLLDLEMLQKYEQVWAVMQNRRGHNGMPPLSKVYRKNAYDNNEDRYGVERYQGIPLYAPGDTLRPERYGLDGGLLKLLKADSTSFLRVKVASIPGEWLVPKKYVRHIDSLPFRKVIFVDRRNQNIATMERDGARWLVRSMNPATTGSRRPPYQRETPLGVFVVQEKKEKMIYLEDGTTDVGGFAPWASRFCNGAYVHGVPVNVPAKDEIEYSRTLGTTPRSHMCVRNATSHAKFVFDWAPVEKTLVFVIE